MNNYNTPEVRDQRMIRTSGLKISQLSYFRKTFCRTQVPTHRGEESLTHSVLPVVQP